jgi:uncharacterized protein YecA (UPF0149 family)
MGAIAEALVAYAQPLIDQTDGSLEQMQKAFTISQLCYNLALLPEDKRETSIREMQPSLQMDDEEFEAFRSSVFIPMIRRHEEMFPLMHRRGSAASSQSGLSPRPQRSGTAAVESFAGTDRYAPCPCGSGEKYKFCCGKKGR